MEILIALLTISLICAVFKINDMRKEKEIYLRIKEQLDVVYAELETATNNVNDLTVKNNELIKDIKAYQTDMDFIVLQYSEALMQVFPRLFMMEVSAAIHQGGIVRQALKLNDALVQEFLTSMFAVLLQIRKDPDSTPKAIELASKEHVRKYFMDYILYTRNGEFLPIKGVEGFDLVNEVVAAIMSHSTDGILGKPKYKLVALPETI